MRREGARSARFFDSRRPWPAASDRELTQINPDGPQSPYRHAMSPPRGPYPDGQERLAVLSPRERQVLTLIARGKSAKGIGLILKISPRTVNVHSASIIRKLGADNRLQAVAIAVRAGLLAKDR